MKRYFTSTIQPDEARFHCESEYHWMSLPGPLGDHTGGWIIVMMDGEFEPDPLWTELPHLVENAVANFNGLDTTGVAPATTAIPIGAIQPGDNNHWSADPATSSTVTPPPAWSATAAFAKGDTVTHNGAAYTAKTKQPGAVRLTDTTYQVAKKLAVINSHFHP